MTPEAKERLAAIAANPPNRCPFCGRRPTVGGGQKYKADREVGRWTFKPEVNCGRQCPVRAHAYGDSVAECLEKWNTRA